MPLRRASQKWNPSLTRTPPKLSLPHRISSLPDQLPVEQLASLQRAWRGWSSPLRHLVAAFGACGDPSIMGEGVAMGLLTTSDAQWLADMATTAASPWRTRQAWTLALTACLEALSLPTPAVAGHYLDMASGMTMDAACIANSYESVAMSARAARVLTATAGRRAALAVSDVLYAACAAEHSSINLALAPVPTFTLGGRIYAY